jgi:hypothetical protein
VVVGGSSDEPMFGCLSLPVNVVTSGAQPHVEATHGTGADTRLPSGTTGNHGMLISSSSRSSIPPVGCVFDDSNPLALFTGATQPGAGLVESRCSW